MFAKDVKLLQVIAPALYSADTTPVALDLVGGRDATIILELGAGGITFDTSNKIEFVLTHSDDNSNYEAVKTADIAGAAEITDGIVAALTAAHATATVEAIKYIGNKRYLKLLADFSGTHATGTALAATLVQTDLYKRP
ncbi:MAG: hypothetical protein Q4E34_01060 [Synergistaceae bacterium]|nr:hypothetical protein [Synergistaceae bacterium]